MIEHRNTVNRLWWATDVRPGRTGSGAVLDLGELRLGGVRGVRAADERWLDTGRTRCAVGAGRGAVGEHGAVGDVALVQTQGLPASVRTVNLAGEALKRSVVEGVFQRSAAQSVVNLYGPTETTSTLRGTG